MRNVHVIFRWTIRVVWSSPAMFFDVGNVSSLRQTMARVCDNCRCRQSLEHVATVSISQFRGKSTILHVHFTVLRSSISHFALYQHPPPDGPARRTGHWHLQPQEASNLDGPCTNLCGKKGQCILFLCYSLWYFVLSYSICYINCH